MSLLLDALNGKTVARPPVWFMRQAGRVSRSYNALREKHTFFQLIQTPDLAAEVTLQPVRELGVDAAILFSDILVIPQALGMDLQFLDEGPRFPSPLCELASSDVMSHLIYNPYALSYVYKTIQKIKEIKPKDVPLIGFCGAPLTVFLYMMEGVGRNNLFPKAIASLYQNKELAYQVLSLITETSLDYLRRQVVAGIDCFQLFDTWAGIIPEDFYCDFIHPFNQQFFAEAKKLNIPLIFFPRGIGNTYRLFITDNIAGISIDWQNSLTYWRNVFPSTIVVQGNLDPRLLQTINGDSAKSISIIRKILHSYPFDGRMIFNLGHGILPKTNEKTVSLLVEEIKNYSWNNS